jgi:hypothetical protein
VAIEDNKYMIDMLPPPTTASQPEGDCVRQLTPEEIQQYVKPGYDATNNPLPDPAYSTFVGVLRRGRVVASIGLQLKLHAQPLQIEDGYASVLPQLVEGAEKIILERTGPQWVYLFTPAGRLAQIASAMGMQLEPWVVMSKLVAPPQPSRIVVDDIPSLTVEPEDLNVVRPE